MKRTNLVLDEQLLDEALRMSGERTYSAVVATALADYVRRIKAGRILELAGSGLWEGDLGAMRRAAPATDPREGPWFSLTRRSGSRSSAATPRSA